MTIDRELFFKIQTKHFSYIPFNQTSEWLSSTSKDTEIHYFVSDTENPSIACWGRVFNRRFVGKHLMIDGIAIQTDNIKVIRDFFLEITNQGFSIIEISDINEYFTNFEIGIRQSGFIRPLLSLSPLSLIVRTQGGFKFHRNWRRNVRKALKTEYEFEVIDNPTDYHLKEFLRLFNQLKERKSLGFTISIESIAKLLNSSNYKLFFVKDIEGEPVSGRVVYICGDKSYDVYAANSYQGIENGAAYFIQECVLNYLEEIGVKQFDFGRISPSNDEMNNIYVAKNYSGGEPIAYNGQWYYSKNRQVGLLYEFYKFLIKKQRRF